jgi:hypothetical protein
MPNRKAVERYTTWAALKPQLKGVRLGAAKPQLACVHIGDGHVTVDAAALRDWTQVVEGAKFWLDVVDLPEMTQAGLSKPLYSFTTMFPPRHLRVLAARTVDGQKLSARFYEKNLAADNVWQVYL